METIPHEALPDYGITTNHNVMDNGELRFRLSGADGSGYIRTEIPGHSGWENSHWHARLSELCLVQQGSLVYAELKEGKVETRTYTAGEYFIVPPLVHHNCCPAPGTILHTIKFGDCSAPDWNPSPELDGLLQKNGSLA